MPGKIHFLGISRNLRRPAIRPSKKQALQTCISRCFRSGRHDPKTPQLLFGALRGILVRSPPTRELGDEDRVRLQGLEKSCAAEPCHSDLRDTSLFVNLDCYL
jgi:hypothetical protein